MTQPIDWISRSAQCRGRLIAVHSAMLEVLTMIENDRVNTARGLLVRHVQSLSKYLDELDFEDAQKFYEYSLDCRRLS